MCFRRLLVPLLLILPAIASAQDAGFRIVSHQLKVTIAPSSHRLMVMDRVVFEVTGRNERQIAVILNKNLVVAWISHQGRLVSFHSRELPGGPQASGGGRGPDPRLAHTVLIVLDRPAITGERLVLDFDYAGELQDPPKEPRHLRFVTPSETSGHIGSEGVYIGPETHWYPDIPNSLASYRVTSMTPQGWETVAQGRLVARDLTSQGVMTTWNTEAPTEGLTLTAGRFIVTVKQCEKTEVATYLYPDDAALADLYLTSACSYLQTYAGLLGAYPFPRFSIVENFFASGLGMPSYTLLGAGSIRRRYIQPYALGHEIVHSWLGNYVFNDDGGNWVEGLTTYLANYYWHELQGDLAKARAERRMMLLTYAVYVPPDQDYPIARFTQKANQLDSAIGYSKAAMVFHMLRREIGDDRFFQAVRELIAEYGGRRAGWRDLARVFGRASSRNLEAFWARWIEQPGSLEMAEGSDPDFHLFRRIPRRELPAMLNLFVTDSQRIVLLPSGDPQPNENYRRLAERVSQDGVSMVSAENLPLKRLADASVLILGGPASGAAFDWARKGLHGDVDLRRDGFLVGGKEYRGEGMAVLLSLRNPDNPQHVVSIFYGLSEQAVKPVAPLLFFYGWNSFVVFDKGVVVARGDEEPSNR
jgi:aminopeptidase N